MLRPRYHWHILMLRRENKKQPLPLSVAQLSLFNCCHYSLSTSSIVLNYLFLFTSKNKNFHWKVKLTMSIRQGQRITEQRSSLPHANCRTGDEISWHSGKCAGKNIAIVNKSHITKLLVFSEKGVANANPVKKVYLHFQSSRVRFLTHSN